MRKIIYQGLQIAILLVMILLNSCAKKQAVIWQGQHADIETHEQPKEDFKVDDFIVVAYAPCEYDENSEVLYKFALTVEGKQIGLIYLEDASTYGYLFSHEYFKKYYFCIKDLSKFSVTDYDTYVTFGLWRDRPEYKALKYEVITAVTGTHYLSYTQSIGQDDSIKIILSSDGTWYPNFFSDSSYLMTIALPVFVTVEGGQRVKLEKDRTWDFISSESDRLLDKNISATISLNADFKGIEVLPYYLVEKKPNPIFSPIPIYPYPAEKAGIQGTTVVKSLVNIDGNIIITKILKTSRCSYLDLAALICAMKARFSPAMQRDKAVKVWVSRPYKFEFR
jgi:TonB family protein